MSAAPDALQPPSTNRSLPSFTPLRHDSHGSEKGESSGSNSWRRSWTSHGSDDHEPRAPEANGQSSGSAARDEDKDNYEVNGSVSKRTKSRHSGGFLLDSGFQPSRLSKAFLSRSHKGPKDLKGKRKSEDGDLVVPKRRLARQHDQHRSSIGGSPLATELKHDIDASDRLEQGSSEAGSQSQRSGLHTASQKQENEHEAPATPSMPRPAPPNIGFDTDPAQIVNMALSLSQGRRRQFSGARVVSGHTMDRRFASTGQATNMRNPRPAGSTGQYLTEQRQTSRNFSPRSRNSLVAEPEPRAILDETVIGNWPHEELQQVDEEPSENMYNVSPATFARVQKAKAHFELLYHYRRLLPHLPPLRQPGTLTGSSVPTEEGRVYNPLQYVRDRKLRFWERKPIPSEEQGWHDVEQVKTWVDTVIASHREPRYDPDECVRLPDLSHRKAAGVEETDPMDMDSPTASIRRPGDNLPTKPRRPKSDWVTHPGDLLADAFWLEQGLNKTKIEDREGNKIYSPDTQFQYSGWRNRVPAQMPAVQQEPTPPPDEASKSVPVPTPPGVPELPSFTSAIRGQERASRGRRRDKIRESIINMPKSETGSGDRRRKLRKEFEMSSSSEDSEDGSSTRGRKRRSSRRKPRASPHKSSNAIDGHGKDVLDVNEDLFGSPSGETSLPTSKRASIVDGSKISKLLSRNGSKPSSSRQHSSRRSESIRRSFEQQRQPRSSLDEELRPRTSAEYDTTAPSSPTAVGFPSIAINLSPPQSRSPSPSKKPVQARLNPFHTRSSSKKRNGIDATDFASIDRTSRNASSEADKPELTSEPNSRGTSPMTRGTSPMTKRDSIVSDDSAAQREPHRSSTTSKISIKSSTYQAEHPSKIRGIFKGGRIAELVGNEVSRVGDFIWKRDVPSTHTHTPRVSTSTASLNSLNASDTDEDLPHSNGLALKTPPKAHAGRFPSSGDESIDDRLSPTQSRSKISSGEKPQYHNPNLPTFTSPFQRDRDQQDERDRNLLTPASSPPQQEDADHISRLAANHRSVSRSPRMDRLAPPKLVTTSTSSTNHTGGADRRNSYGFGRPLDLTRSANASQVFNDALKNQPKDAPVTGLASLKASTSGSNLRQDWNTLQPDTNAAVTRRDIARARALLLSSGVKAREINRRAHAIQEPPRKFVLDTLQPSDPALHSSTPLRIPRKEEHVVAARNLIASLTSQSAAFREILDDFTTKNTPALHKDLQALDDLVDNELTPRVRMAADQAGELSMKLSTTSTLAVKGLNDVIESVMRRRRRGPVRYVRRFGYLMIEWTVVGLLWAIWLVVTVVRICLGTVKGVWRVGRWLLWL